MKFAIVGDPANNVDSSYSCSGAVGNIDFFEGPTDGSDTCNTYTEFLSDSTNNKDPCVNIHTYNELPANTGCDVNADFDNTMSYI